MEFSHQVHAFVAQDGALHLWIEKVAGREVVTHLASLSAGSLPSQLLELVQVKRLRARGEFVVCTPKGRTRQLPIPTIAFTPAESWDVLGEINRYLHQLTPPFGGSEGARAPGVSPEVVFLADVARFVAEAVRAGRVMLQMRRIDNEWLPHWGLSSAGSHVSTLREFRSAAPGVLTANGSADVVEIFADALAHAYVVKQLSNHPDLISGMDSPFVQSLASGQPLRRVSAATVSHLNEWRASAEDAATQLVLVLSSPADATPRASDAKFAVDAEDDDAQSLTAASEGTEEPVWRLEFALSRNGGPAESLRASLTSEPVLHRLRAKFQVLRSVWPEVNEWLRPVDAWLHSGVWMPPPELLSGDQRADRFIAVALGIHQVEILLTRGIGVLATAGVQVMVPRGWTRAKTVVRAKSTPVGAGPGSNKIGLDQLLQFDWEVSVDGQQLDSHAKLALLDSARNVVEINGRYVFLDSAALSQARRWFRRLKEADKSDSPEQTGAPTGHPLVSVQDLLQAEAASELHGDGGDHAFRVENHGWYAQLFSEDPVNAPEHITVPPTVVTELRDHQRRGLNWLVWMYRHNLGAIVADDMGLGKTLQVLALLAWERQESADSATAVPPTLVIAPTSVLDAWQREATTHVPSMQVLVDHGSRRVCDGGFPAAAGDVDVVVTSYGLVSRNPERYAQVPWRRIVADEAQHIKNPATKQSQAVRSLRAEHRVALTGTPVENRLSDLYALMDFCNPGILGTPAAFQNRIGIPVERHGDEQAVQRLRKITQPFVLRRVKDDEALGLELPEKTEIVEKIALSDEQAALYQAYTTRVQEMIRNKEQGRRGAILGALVKIKQICNHPAHYAGDGSGLMRNGRHRSNKVERLFEIVEQARGQGRKVLIFTQFPTFGAMLIPALENVLDESVPMLHGGSSANRRKELVESFQSADGPGVMVLSVRAGGTGITLTEASVVIHVDRWWNPAVEDQATDRAYRIGQHQHVTVYKFVAQGTLDERIHDIIVGKRELAGSIVGSGEGWIANLTDAELAEMMHLRTVSQEVTK